MQKRKDRIEKWRAERKKQLLAEVKETLACMCPLDLPFLFVIPLSFIILSCSFFLKGLG